MIFLKNGQNKLNKQRIRKNELLGSRRIQEWVEHKRDLDRAALMTEERKETVEISDVGLIAGHSFVRSFILQQLKLTTTINFN